MSQGSDRTLNLVWIDLEMTGLDTVNDRIIEIATIVTDAELNVVAEGPSIAIHQPDEGAGAGWLAGWLAVCVGGGGAAGCCS